MGREEERWRRLRGRRGEEGERGEERRKEVTRKKKAEQGRMERVKEGKEKSWAVCCMKGGKEEGRRAAGHTSRPGNKEAKNSPSSPSSIPPHPSIPRKHKLSLLTGRE